MARMSVESHYGAYIIGSRRDPETGERGRLVQVDYDFPAAAQDLGWNPRRVQRTPAKHSALSPLCTCGETRIMQRAPNRGKGCYHRSTDMTSDCRDCGVTVGDFIAAAAEFLDSLC